MGRLLNFARPLTPRVQVTPVGELLDAAVAASNRPATDGTGAVFELLLPMVR